MDKLQTFETLTLPERDLLREIAELTEMPAGAFNLRLNGQGAIRQVSGLVEIKSKTDKPGIDIIVAPGCVGETVHIPVVLTKSGLEDLVYNDFYIGDGADVTIVAGCGIHNDGCNETKHNGIHSFHIGKNARVRYTEKHLAVGPGAGSKVFNPTTVVAQEEGSHCEMEMVQIGGVDDTLRVTEAHLGKGAKLVLTERLLTEGAQRANTDMKIHLDGAGSVAQIISRTVAQGNSSQVFRANAEGNNACQAHIQCDSIIMDGARVSSIPEITANHPEAQIIHEAAIGRINNDQLLKLQSFGMEAEEAEQVIIEGFLK